MNDNLSPPQIEFFRRLCAHPADMAWYSLFLGLKANTTCKNTRHTCEVINQAYLRIVAEKIARITPNPHADKFRNAIISVATHEAGMTRREAEDLAEITMYTINDYLGGMEDE